MLSVVLILATLALIFAVVSILPVVHSYSTYMQAVAIILLSVAVMVGG